MSEAPADSRAEAGMRSPTALSWSRARWFTLIALLFGIHVALLYGFGARKQITPRAATHVFSLRLAGTGLPLDDPARSKLANAWNEWLALNNPTLFALPQANELSASALQAEPLPPPSFYWTEAPKWLPLTEDKPGIIFGEPETNRARGAGGPKTFASSLQPPVTLSLPALPFEPALPQTSTLEIKGELARRLLNSPVLPLLYYNNVLAPSRVQILVDAAGNVASAILLPPENADEAAASDTAADTKALNIARTLRFSPATGLTYGQVVFRWHTLPEASTNMPAAQP